MKVASEEIRFKTNMEEITHKIKRRRWKLIGHVPRKSVNENARIALTWTPEGRRRRGRPKKTWRRTVERERGELGFKGWTEAGSCATEKLGERERKALFLSERTGQDDDVNPFPSSYSHLEDGVASLFFLSRNIWPCCKNDLLNNIFFVSLLSLDGLSIPLLLNRNRFHLRS